MPGTTDPTASRQMFELERALAQLSSGAAAGDPAGGLKGMYFLRRCSRNAQRSGRHGPLAPIPRPRHSSQAFGYGGTPFRLWRRLPDASHSGAGLVTYFTTRQHKASGYLREEVSMAAIEQLELLAGRKAVDRPSAAAPTAAADADEDDLPIPSDINAVLLGGLFCACDARRLLCGRRDRASLCT